MGMKSFRKLDNLTLNHTKYMYNQYKILSKSSLSIMNASMCVTGFLLSGNFCLMDIKVLQLGTGSLFMALSSQAAGQLKEIKEDSLMIRTKKRPLITQTIDKKNAYLFITSSYLMSNAIFYSFFDTRTLLIANLTFYGYLYGYIPLKKKSEFNTIFGAWIGALPIILGWSANGLDLLSSYPPLYLTLFMTGWQIPHFYGILWSNRFDYDKAGFIMIKDKNKATKHMYISTLLKLISINGLIYEESIGVVFGALTLLSLYKDNYKSILEFNKNPNIDRAKNLKKSAYKTIGYLVLGILIKLSGIDYDNKLLLKLIESYK